MTAVEMEVENGARQAMDTEDVDSSGSSSDASGEEVESGREAMEGSDEENEESHANPAFSKFMQGFWDLASVDVPVRYVAATLLLLNPSDSSGTLAKCVCMQRRKAAVAASATATAVAAANAVWACCLGCLCFYTYVNVW